MDSIKKKRIKKRDKGLSAKRHQRAWTVAWPGLGVRITGVFSPGSAVDLLGDLGEIMEPPVCLSFLISKM